MEHLRVLVVHNGLTKDHLQKLTDAIDLIAKKMNISDIKDSIDYEDLVAFKDSHRLRQDHSAYGYFLIVGQTAHDKIVPQIDKGINSFRVIGSPEFWVDKVTRQQAALNIHHLFKDWQAFHTEKRVLVSKPKETEGTNLDWIEGNVNDVQKWLELQLKNSRFQALIFSVEDDANPHLEIKDATKKLKAPIDEVTPILVSEEVINDESKLETAKSWVKKSGYEEPYFLTIREFMVMLRVMCQLARSGKARIEVGL